ncbi:ATP-binding protein [Ceratocystis pirilliformis]|uniref:ATP-binding protein n=1 Tax=Ceratocystis pirilliformis TaxID=259994 RepID=A0ABR3ZKC9_9PEZI
MTCVRASTSAKSHLGPMTSLAFKPTSPVGLALPPVVTVAFKSHSTNITQSRLRNKGLTISRLAYTHNYGPRLFSSSAIRPSTPRCTRDFGSGFSNSYDPNIESRRGPIFKNKATGVPPFYPRDLKAKVDDYVVGQDRAKKTICSTIFNHYQAVRRRNEFEIEERSTREKLQRQQLARDRELRDLRNADALAGTSGPDQNGRDDDPVYSQYDPEDSTPHEYTMNAPQNPSATLPGAYTRNHIQTTLDIALSSPLQQTENPNMPDHINIDKSNLLLIGPTGVGKTYILETLSKKLKVPFSISDCNSFTQAGYIGQDVETCIERLLIEANYDVKAAENGIVVLDEFDKISRRESNNGRDVGGEGVQQALLKLVEGSKVTLNIKDTRPSRTATPIPSTYGSVPPPPSLPPQGGQSGKTEQYIVDTRNILFVFCGAFVGLDKLILRRVSRPVLGFGADVKSGPKSRGAGPDVLPLEMYSHLPHQPIQHPGSADPSSKFSPLDLTTPADLQAFGFIPELIGRVHNICALSNLSVDDLYRVLTEPRNCLVSQYTALFETYPSRLFFTRKALRTIAERAAKSGTGARGLKMEMERVLSEPIFDAPMPYVLITEACVNGTEKAGYWGKDGRFEVERQMADEDKLEGNATGLEDMIVDDQQSKIAGLGSA